MEDDNLPASAADKLRRNIERTKDIRFHASKRLLNRQNNSSYAVSWLSCLVILISLSPNFTSVSHQQNQIILAVSIVLSVVIIFTSLIYSSQNYFYRSKVLHDCAIKLSRLEGEVNLTIIQSLLNVDRLKRLWDRYNSILEECPSNHDDCDLNLERAVKPQLFPSYFSWGKADFLLVGWNYFLWFTRSNMWLLLPIVASGLSLWMLYSLSVAPLN